MSAGGATPDHAGPLGPDQLASLLAGTPVAPARGPVIRQFDFRRPSKFSKEHLRTMELLHETFGRLASVPLSAALRAPVELRVVSAQECTYSEFHEIVGPDSLVAVIQSPPLPGNSVLGLRASFALTLIDRMLGGPGDPDAAGRGAHEPTEIETALLARTLEGMLRWLSEAWQAIAPVSFRLTGIEPSAQFAQAVAGGEMAMLVQLELRVGDTPGQMFLSLPYLTLEPILQKLSVQEYFSGRHQDTRQERRDMHEELPRVPIVLRAELGRIELPYGTVRSLRAGSVVRLGADAAADIGVWVADELAFQARPGRQGRRAIVQITRRLAEAEEVAAG